MTARQLAEQTVLAPLLAGRPQLALLLLWKLPRWRCVYLSNRCLVRANAASWACRRTVSAVSALCYTAMSVLGTRHVRCSWIFKTGAMLLTPWMSRLCNPCGPTRL